MKRLLLKSMAFMTLLFTSLSGQATEPMPLSKDIYSNSHLSFVSHQGAGPFDTALAMTIQYPPIKSIRQSLNAYLHYSLNYFTGWDKEGEAHITVITPPEYTNVLKPFVSIDRIEAIALQNDIQGSELNILGLGRGVVTINEKAEETYFLIVKSKNLVKIRQQIHEEFVKNGGNKNAWNPKHFHPHITIGYSLRDLHEADGVIKDRMHSEDYRFELVLTD